MNSNSLNLKVLSVFSGIAELSYELRLNMASAQSLDSDKLSGQTEMKQSDDFRTCSLCKHYNSRRNGSENPVHSWLTMDTRDRDRHIRHMKNCILTPFLFGKKMNYSSKNISWLKHLRLIPISSSSWHSRSCLSDRFIEVADLAEEIVDTVLSCLVSEEFLHNSYHTYKELTDCHCVEKALSIGKRSEFVSLMSHCFNGNHCLDNKRIQLISLTVLHQVMKHICQTAQHGDHLTKFEDAVKRKELDCTELRLKGNDHFAAGEYQAAVACYSHAIEFSLFDPLLYGNRALSYLKLRKLREALSDAKRAVYLKPEWEKGHYRFAQAYFELGFPEKAMAVNSFAQKCCSSTLNLLCQAVAFKREIAESAERNKAQCCSSNIEQSASSSRQHHQASCENPHTSRTKVGIKRNWKIANQADAHDPVLTCSVRKDILRHKRVDEEDNHNTCSDKDNDSDLELSDHDSLPPLIYDSSDDLNDDDDDDNDSLWSEYSDLPALASFSESDTESDSEPEEQLSSHDECCVSDDLLFCSDTECRCCNCCDEDDDDSDDDDLNNSESDCDEHDGDESDESDEGIDNVDVLRSLMFPPLLNSEVNPLVVLGVIHGFLTAHPEMANEGTPPALPEVIESLPKTKVTKEQVAVSLSCSICRCDYEEDETVVELPCLHLFHPSCITTWLKMHATCPTCRDVLPH